MNYTEARNFIESIAARGSQLGLTTITNLLNMLGNPQDDLKFIHVAGTNGKGSVLAYLSSILQEAGYSVGRYISPTLFAYRNRIQIDQEPISREDFAQLVTETAEAMQRMETAGMALPTVFEVETAVSFLYFKKRGCDLVLLEVGMGGRLDATNIIRTPVLTVLTSISMDHMEFLGNTLGEIAWNKAGILKTGIPAVSAHQAEEARMVIRAEADKLGCSCSFVDPAGFRAVEYGLTRQQFSYREFDGMEISLAGLHQIGNAALALEGVEQLRKAGYAITADQVRNGLKKTVWKGRFSVIHEKPYVIIDGAHNPDAAQRLREAAETYFPKCKKYYIMGVFSDKEYDKIIEITAPLAERIFTVETPDNPRALPAEQLAEAVKRVNPNAEAAKSITDAVEKSFAAAQEEDVILIFGSLSFLGAIEQAVQQVSSTPNAAEEDR